MRGKIEEGEHRKLVHKLDWTDAINIARIAKSVARLDKHIDWLRVALKYCEDNKRKEQVAKELERAIMDHDSILLKYGLGHITEKAPDGLPQVPVFTFKQPVEQLGTKSKIYEKSVKIFGEESKLVQSGENIKPLENPTETKFLTRTFHRMWYYGQNATFSLCKGQTIRLRLECSFNITSNFPSL